MAYAVLSEFSRFATPKTNVETDLALFLSLTARCVPVAPPEALGSVGEAIAQSLPSPESTSRRTHLTPPRGRSRYARRPRWQWAIRGRMPRRSAGANLVNPVGSKRPHQRRQRHLGRLMTIEDCLDDVRCRQGWPQYPAHIGGVNFFRAASSSMVP